MSAPTNTKRQPLAVADSNANINPAIQYLSDSKRPGTVTTASTSLKRAADFDEESDDDSSYHVTENCDQVRRKIRSFLASGEMNIGEFTKAIGCSNKAYNSFMAQNGRMKGDNHAAYHLAFRFFQKREAKGIKVPKKKVKKVEEEKKLDVEGIKLPGEEEIAVKVYDSCDEIRKKINAYLRQPGVTQAGFLREIAKTYPDGRKIQSKVLNDFLSKKGASAGNRSAVFYSAYVFFEKMRIRDGKPKSKHREEMERVHPRGFDTERRNTGWVTCMEGEMPYEDEYGNLHIAGRRGR